MVVLRNFKPKRLGIIAGTGGAGAGTFGAYVALSYGVHKLLPKQSRSVFQSVLITGLTGAGTVLGYFAGSMATPYVKEIPFIGEILTGEKSTPVKLVQDLVQGVTSSTQHVANVLIPPSGYTTWAASDRFPSPYNLGMPSDLTMARKWAVGRVNYGLTKGWYSDKALASRIMSFSLNQIKAIKW